MAGGVASSPLAVLSYADRAGDSRLQGRAGKTLARQWHQAATIDGTPDFVDDYVYDSEGRIVTVTEHGVDGGNAVAEKRIELSYNDVDQLVSIDRYLDGQLAVEADYTYDSQGCLVGLVYHQGDTTLATYAWTYSSNGTSSLTSLPSSLSSWLPSGGLLPVHDVAGVTTALMSGDLGDLDLLTSCTSSDGLVAYTYDASGQLLSATYSSSNPQSPIPNPETYSYDSNGNRTNSGYVTGSDNRLLSDGTYRYAYDAEGNRTARFIDVNADGLLNSGDSDVTEYTWDARNRLVTVTDRATADGAATQIVHYVYDVENRWIGESIDTNGDGQIDHETRFAYDGNQIVLEFDKDVSSPLPPGEGQGEGTGLAASDLSHRYLWQPNAVDQVLADERISDADEVLWPLTDQLGSVRDVARTDQGATSVVDHVIYDSFGEVVSETNAAEGSLFGFTGRPLDRATALQNNLNRWYDAEVGRWMSKDPIAFEGEDGNTYRYVGNSPTNATDPSGLAETVIVEHWTDANAALGIANEGKFVTERKFVYFAEQNAGKLGIPQSQQAVKTARLIAELSTSGQVEISSAAYKKLLAECREKATEIVAKETGWSSAYSGFKKLVTDKSYELLDDALASMKGNVFKLNTAQGVTYVVRKTAQELITVLGIEGAPQATQVALGRAAQSVATSSAIAKGVLRWGVKAMILPLIVADTWNSMAGEARAEEIDWQRNWVKSPDSTDFTVRVAEQVYRQRWVEGNSWAALWFGDTEGHWELECVTPPNLVSGRINMTVGTAKTINGTEVRSALFNRYVTTFFGNQELVMFKDTKVRVIIVDR